MSKQNKKSLFSYLAKYKLGIALYITFYILGGTCSVLTTIFFAEAITQVTINDFEKKGVEIREIMGH